MIAREGWPFVIAGLAVAALGALWQPWAAIPGVAFTLFTLWFFRDPERRPPADPELLISPCDGKVIVVDGRMISVFMDVTNVHVCRSPVAGRVDSVVHHPGRFLAAFKGEASEENERVVFAVTSERGEVRFQLVAGLIARRIVPWSEAGDAVAGGERIGLIRFGSRVDLWLPTGARALTEVGAKVRAGETPLARWLR